MTRPLQPHFLVLGPSGVGSSTVLNHFSEHGYLIVDDIAPTDFQSVFHSLQQVNQPLALSIRYQQGHEALCPPETLKAQLSELLSSEVLEETSPLKILFLEAAEETLIQRYLSLQIRHPFESEGLHQGIAHERGIYKVLEPLKQFAINTTTTPKNELRFKVGKLLGIEMPSPAFTLHFTSFGFRYGIPLDAELLFDMRFIKNPFYEPALRPMTGLDQPVKAFIFAYPEAEAFLKQFSSLLQTVIPAYQKEGKSRLTVGIGCTGGQHRSVCIAEALATHLKTDSAFQITVTHREMSRWPSVKALS